MTAEITFDDYQKIGMMETALSNHADEAFFELSSEGQKLAEKIFKCLTETDRENREIRRAMTVEKLCAATGADFSDVSAVIETFRTEGRTFLMPPPEFKLTENSLVDISHESLIRKWERLKIWVEEEGQSARTYRRLAEDAFLHEQSKVGFWSDPELKDALEWRENFKPNETWAELYGETGERRYRASFADSMQYLDDSKLDRDQKLAKEKRQRRVLFALSVLFFLTTISAVYAYSIAQKNAQEATQNAQVAAMNEMQARDLTKQLLKSEEETKKANDSLKTTNDKLKESENSLLEKNDELEEINDELEESLINAGKQTKIAQNEKERADNEAQQAKLSEEAKQTALEEQNRLRIEAEKKQEELANALAEVEATISRGEINQSGLVFIEQGEFGRALPEFQKLLARYEDRNEPMTTESRNDGKWWTLHNLGIVYSKLPGKGTQSECSYQKALNILQYKLAFLNSLAFLNRSGEMFDDSKCPPEQSVNSNQNNARDAEPIDEINRSQVATLRRLAQFYREQAVNSTDESEATKFNESAVKNYNKLLEILPKETYYGKDKIYPADVYVELADTLADLNGWNFNSQVWKLYNDAINTYSIKKEFVKEVDVRIKLAEFSINYDFKKDDAIGLLEETIRIQEDEKRMNLPPIDNEIAVSYFILARANTDNKYNGDLYLALARKISDLDFEINKPDGFKVEEFVALADAYVKVGKCGRAREVFTYGIEQNRVDVNFGQYILSRAAMFHNDVLHDKKEAKKYFDEFYKEFKRNPENLFAFEYIDDYVTAGDFYLAQEEYAKASELYEFALRINSEKIRHFEGLINQAKGDKSSLDLKRQKFTAKNRRIDIVEKTARVYATQNQPETAEAKFAEANKLIFEFETEFSSSVIIKIIKAKVLLSQGDFYLNSGKTEIANKIYKQAENILINLPSINKLQVVYTIRVKKRLGDMSRNNAEAAAEYYNAALTSLREIQSLFTTSQSQISDDYFPYIKNGNLTAEFYTDQAEILEALMSLNAVKVTDELKAELNNAQSKAKELKTMEEKSPCER